VSTCVKFGAPSHVLGGWQQCLADNDTRSGAMRVCPPPTECAFVRETKPSACGIARVPSAEHVFRHTCAIRRTRVSSRRWGHLRDVTRAPSHLRRWRLRVVCSGLSTHLCMAPTPSAISASTTYAGAAHGAFAFVHALPMYRVRASTGHMCATCTRNRRRLGTVRKCAHGNESREQTGR